jgi:hypothetical protein
MNHELYSLIQGLLVEVTREHDKIFKAASKRNSEWPIWYADYLHESLKTMLEADFSKSELIYLLVMLDRSQALEAPGIDWSRYAAQFFVETYG